MKVGIITIPDFDNYGNRLQNYALQELVKSVGCDVVSYVPYKPSILKKSIKSLFGVGMNGSISNRFRKIRRLSKFMKFDKKYVHTVQIGTTSFPSSLNEECDCFIAGSDQIWNPEWYTNYALLDFVYGKKKFAYAASFGCDMISDTIIKIYKEHFDSFDIITVRENTGKLIMNDCFNMDVAVVPDPTFALTAEEWRKIERIPKIKSSDAPYILLYFLGGVDAKRQSQIDSLIRNEETNISINLLNCFNSSVYESGPSEFIYLIDNAELVLTDSFHACVFSILMHKRFIVFERLGSGKTMANRIETLLERFQLEQCMYSKKNISRLTNDFSSIDAICALERQRALTTLREMIKDVESNAV